MQRINSECDKRKKSVDCQIVPVSYYCRLNTPKGTAKAPTVDFSRLGLRRPIRKSDGEGRGKKQKQNHVREGD